MPKLGIDMHEVVAGLSKSIPRQRDAAVAARSLASAIHTEWKGLAQSELGTSSRDYQAGLQAPQEIRPGLMSIVLVGTVPNLVEHGMPPTDLRTTVIPNAKRKHTSAEGFEYVHVPFRHGSAGSKGNAGRPMPRPIHNAAKHLAAKISGHGQKPFDQHPTGRDTRLTPGMTHINAHRVSKAAQAHLEERIRPWHSSSIFAGMVKEQKTYEAATQSQYKTWRTITENPAAHTDSRKWMHPGIKAKNFAMRASLKMIRRLNQMMDQVLGGQGE